MSVSPAESTPTAETEKSRQALLREAYGAATTRLREARREEFDSLYVQEAQARGVDYKPKPTAEQKAEAELAELLEKFPHLRDKVSAETAAG